MPKLLSSKVNSPETTGHRDYIIEGKIIDEGVVKSLTYYETAGNRSKWGSELYQGKNYVVGSTAPSYSRNYVHWRGMPAKYLPIAKRLKATHRRKFAGKP